jgi:membrane-associated protein
VTAHVTPLLLGIKWTDPTWLLHHYGTEFLWISLIMIFIECGLFFPFLPGDTLVLSLGVFAAYPKRGIDIFPGNTWVELICIDLLLLAAAILGNVAGYEIGRKLGPPIYRRDGRILKREYLDNTRAFFDQHGNKALVVGRFVPFVRTYITLVAGVTRMPRRQFLLWSFVGALAWILSISILGFEVGTRVPWLRDNIDYAILAILLLTAIPIGIEWWRHRRHNDDDATPSDTNVEPAGTSTG